MIAYLIGTAAFAADYASKRWAERSLELNGDKRPVFGGRLFLYRIENRGTAGGHLAGRGSLPLILSGTALAAAAVHQHRTRKESSTLTRIGSSLIIAGGLGNLCDRVRRGAVTDFAAVRHRDGTIGRYVYNAADAAIAAGAAAIILGECLGEKKKA